MRTQVTFSWHIKICTMKIKQHNINPLPTSCLCISSRAVYNSAFQINSLFLILLTAQLLNPQETYFTIHIFQNAYFIKNLKIFKQTNKTPKYSKLSVISNFGITKHYLLIKSEETNISVLIQYSSMWKTINFILLIDSCSYNKNATERLSYWGFIGEKQRIWLEAI